MINKRVEHCLERLCNKGCQSVWGVIEALEAGQQLSETRGLDASEVNALVNELKEIMAVYEETCSVS